MSKRKRDDDLIVEGELITQILDSMGVQSYEGTVVPQLIEVMHRYSEEVLKDAYDYALHTGRKGRRGGGGGGCGDFHARVAAASHHLLPPLLLRQLPGRSRAVGRSLATTVTGAARSQVMWQSVADMWCSAGGAGVVRRAQWHAHDIAARGPGGRS